MDKRSVYLRAFEQDDYLLINKWRNDEEIQKLTGGTFRYVSSENEKAWVYDKMINNTKYMYFAICLNDGSEKMVAYASLNNIDYIHKTTSGGGITIGDKQYQDGITFIDSACLIYDYAFNELHLNRIQYETLSDHKVIYRLLLSMGFVLEGTLRQSIYKHGKYHDQYILSLIKEDYINIKTNEGYSLSNILKQLKQYK